MSLTNYTGIHNLGTIPLYSGTDFFQFDAPSGLVQNLDGSLSIKPKSPATVAGELILRPLIDCTARAFSTLWQCAQSVDTLFTRAVSFPGVAADLSQKPQSIDNKYIQELDISSMSKPLFRQIFLDNPTTTEDRQRVQLLNEAQIKTAFQRFYGSAPFRHLLSTSQLTILENSLTDQEITAAINEFSYDKINVLLSQSRFDLYIQKLDVSRVHLYLFLDIFTGNPSYSSVDSRRMQLLNAEQLRAVFFSIFDTILFVQCLSSSQLTMLADLLNDQVMTVIFNRLGHGNQFCKSNMQSLFSQTHFNYIQKLDISLLSEQLFNKIFLDNPTTQEDRQRIQLLNDAQINTAFHRFYGSASFGHLLSTAQLTILENSLSDQEITAAINEFSYGKMNYLLSQSRFDFYIQKLDVSRVSEPLFLNIFTASSEDWRRIQLLNAEQLKAVFDRFFDKIPFAEHLSNSQLPLLANSLSDQEITAAINQFANRNQFGNNNFGTSNMQSLFSQTHINYIKKLDISLLSEQLFQKIFLDNPTTAEDRQRIQLLNDEQIKTAFHRFYGSAPFRHLLSTAQLTMLENSISDQEITAAINEFSYGKMNNLLSQWRFDHYIKNIDVSRVSEPLFLNIFTGKPSSSEESRRIQLLNAEQLKAVFDRFFDTVPFAHHLSTSQLPLLANSLTYQEMTAAINKFGNSNQYGKRNMQNLFSQTHFNYIQKLDISLLSEQLFQKIFLDNPTTHEDRRRIQLLNEDQVKIASKKFSDSRYLRSFQDYLSSYQREFITNSQQEATIEKEEALITPQESIHEKPIAKINIQNKPFEEEHTDNPAGKSIKSLDVKRHITFGTTYVKGNPQRDALSKLIDENHQEYASVWNLQHRVVKDNMLKGRCTHNRDTLDCVSYWNKVAVLLEWVNKPAVDTNVEEWYILADDDMPVTNMRVDPYKAIDTLRRDVDTSIIIARDVQLWKNNDAQLSVNTGLFFVRKDARSKKFIEDLWEKRNTPTYSRNENCPTLGTCQNQEVLHEQEAFAQLIQNDRRLLNSVITVVKPRDTYPTTPTSSEEIALNTFNREGCFRREQAHWGSDSFSYDADKNYLDGKWREGDWMGQTAGVPVNGWWCGDYNRNLPSGPIRKDMLKKMLAKVVR